MGISSIRELADSPQVPFGSIHVSSDSDVSRHYSPMPSMSDYSHYDHYSKYVSQPVYSVVFLS